MAVYVDDAFIPFGRMLMCHMMADELDELHEMADAIGVSRRWFQDKSIPHYDVSKSKREEAIKLGAIEEEFYNDGMVAFRREQRRKVRARRGR